MSKSIWGLRYKILLFILLSIVTISGIYNILSFIPKSWGHYESGEFISLRFTISLCLGFILTGFAAYKFYTIKEENFWLKKILYLFYALNPKSKDEIIEYYADTDPHPSISQVIENHYKVTSGDNFLKNKDAAMFLLAERSFSSGEENNLLPYLRKFTQMLDGNPLLLKLRKIEEIISDIIHEDVQIKCKRTIYNLKSNIMDLFLSNNFKEYEIRKALKNMAEIDDNIIIDFIEEVIDYYFREPKYNVNIQTLYNHLLKIEKE